MQALQNKTRHLGFRLEQVQLFTPTPMTLSTETYYTGLDPYTLKPVFTEHSPQNRDRQTDCFFWYKSEDDRKKTAAEKLRRPGYGFKR